MEDPLKRDTEKAKDPIAPGLDQSQIPTASPANAPATGPIGFLRRQLARLADFLSALFGLK